jgi:hypothetical protein
MEEAIEGQLDVLVVDADTASKRAQDVVRIVGSKGYVYVMAGAGSRPARQKLVSHGLAELFDLVEVPPGAPRLLAPATPSSLDWVARCGLVFGDRSAVIGLRFLSRIPRRLGGAFVPAGMLLGGPLAIPPGGDLVDLIPGGAPLGPLVLPLSSTGDRVVALALERSVPVVVTVGVGAAGVATVEREKSALAGIAKIAGGSGADVPRHIGSRRDTHSSSLIQSMVPGRLAANVLERTPARLDPILRSVGAWIARWQRRTAAPGASSDGFIADSVLTPCDRLGATLAPEYRTWLEAVLRDANSVTVADAHGDLTMSNIVLARRGIGVVDWVSATTGRVALQDLIYACCDGAAAIESYADRCKAFESSFRPGGRYAELVSDVVGSVALEVTPATRKLAFHACWLRHALDERERDDSGGPFVAIAAMLSRDPDGYTA